MSELKSLIFIFICIVFANCLETNEDINVIPKKLISEYIGKKGTLVISADAGESKFKEDETRKASFNHTVYDENKTFNVECGLWMHSGDNLYIFCNIGNDIPAGHYSINFKEIPKFVYQDKYIIISSTSSYGFDKVDEDIIDLYSKKQIISIEKGKNTYDLKFNVVSYNQEVLMLRTLGYIFLNCRQENNILNCQINKNELEKGLIKNNLTSNVYYINKRDKGVIVNLPIVGDITITDNITEKVDVFVGITRLLENAAEGGSTFAYETNVTNINKVIADLELSFKNENGSSTGKCTFKKYDDNPLLIICKSPVPSLGKFFYLKEIKEEIIYSDTNIRYNFRIQPVKNEEKIYYSENDKGDYIKMLCPEILDFLKKDSLYIDYVSSNTDSLKGITFNKDKGDLSCEQIINGLLRCTVPKSHFEKNGYYFTKHTNHLNAKSVYYETSPVKVILNENKGSYYSNSLYYYLLLILILF